MTKELDTSWFDLKNYEAFKTMTTEGWIWQLMARDHYYQEIDYHELNSNELNSHDKDKNDRYLLSIANKFKDGVIANQQHYPHEMHNNRAKAILEGHPFSTTSVDSLMSVNLWRMATNDKLNHVWEACKHSLDFSFEEIEGEIYSDDHNNDLVEIAYTPHDFHIKQHSEFNIESSAHVVIDLSATDEQIKNDFSQWLTQYRRAINYPHQKKLFTQVDFDYWIDYGAIQYLDLVLIAKIEGKKITQNKLARMIFPDEYNIDIVERLRKVTKPTAEWLIKSEIYAALSTQLAYEKVTGIKNV